MKNLKDCTKVGVVGYSGKKFDEDIAKALLAIALDIVEEEHKDDDYVLVSGLTDLGIPALAYRMAGKRGWDTMGVACSKAEEYDCFPVNYKVIEGDEWGDESDTFLSSIDVLIRIGGGAQSMDEVETARNKDSIAAVYEYDLPEKK